MIEEAAASAGQGWVAADRNKSPLVFCAWSRPKVAPRS